MNLGIRVKCLGTSFALPGSLLSVGGWSGLCCGVCAIALKSLLVLGFERSNAHCGTLFQLTGSEDTLNSQLVPIAEPFLAQSENQLLSQNRKLLRTSCSDEEATSTVKKPFRTGRYSKQLVQITHY